MGAFSGEHYNELEELELFCSLANSLAQIDPVLADEIVLSIINREFGTETADLDL